MMKRQIQRRSVLIGMIFLLRTVLGFAQATPPADLVLINGNIITVDNYNTIAQAVAVRDSIICKVGSNAEIQEYIESGVTEVLNLNGLTVTPGIIDAHSHILFYGITENEYVNLREAGTHTIEDVVNKIEAKVQISQPGEWIMGDGFFKLERLPTRYDLDPVSPENPVMLQSLGGHYGSCNSKALEIAGVDENTPNPVGGIIDHPHRHAHLPDGKRLQGAQLPLDPIPLRVDCVAVRVDRAVHQRGGDGDIVGDDKARQRRGVRVGVDQRVGDGVARLHLRLIGRVGRLDQGRRLRHVIVHGHCVEDRGAGNGGLKGDPVLEEPCHGIVRNGDGGRDPAGRGAGGERAPPARPVLPLRPVLILHRQAHRRRVGDGGVPAQGRQHPVDRFVYLDYAFNDATKE